MPITSRMIADSYQDGYDAGYRAGIGDAQGRGRVIRGEELRSQRELKRINKPKKKLSDWQKFIKANSSKKKFKFANGKLKLKTMGIAYRKTAAYKRNKKK